ncbi:MAG: DUF3267 domain-containing protein [Clostridia bacterium]|nr:DUF3267 domain-containing protein [Clostridia bacterium]
MERKGKYFESELPEGYRTVKTIDAKDKKVGVILNLIALIPLTISLLVAYYAMGEPTLIADDASVWEFPMSILVSCIVLIAYVIFHELVHGAVYKFFTREKLTFGLTFTVAFCGVPKIYVYRKPALAAVLAPFVVFLPIFLTLCFVLPTPLMKIIAAFMLGLHIGGCAGDLWVSGLLIFKLRDNKTLINDTGPKQTFCIPYTEEN